MSDAPLILGVSGLRGIVGESLTPEIAVRYAGAFGTWLREQGYDQPTVVVGRDGRKGGDQIESAAIEGLVRAGCDVVRMGVAATPSVGYGASAPFVAAGMVITASHNPAEWNGLKCIVYDRGGIGGRARAPLPGEAAEIIRIFESGRVDEVSADTRGTIVAHSNEVAAHIWAVHTAWESWSEKGFSRQPSSIVVVLDSVNCSGSTIAVPLFDRIGLTVHPIACDGSGIFPHTPEPTKENLSGAGGLCDAVPGLKADIGFAQDPDADRLAIVDENGTYIGEEYTPVLCAMALMEARKSGDLDPLPPATGRPVFVVNLSTSRMIDDLAARYDAEVVRTPVGEANVVERMKQLKAQGRDVVMGGEGNGGVIWPEVTYVRDSLSAMALTLALMARTGKKTSELVAMINAMGPGDRGYTILKQKAPLAAKADAAPLLERLANHYKQQPDAAIDTQDGVRIDWPANRTWAHIRPSNTEPILRIIVEAPTEPQATQTALQLQQHIPSGATG